MLSFKVQSSNARDRSFILTSKMGNRYKLYFQDWMKKFYDNNKFLVPNDFFSDMLSYGQMKTLF